MRYRDFYDIPRAVVVEWGGQTWLFDCLYDYDVDDYESEYTVYRLPEEVAEKVDSVSWTDLGHLGERVGAVPTARVSFDPTKREALDAEIFEELGLP
jgi:hypothetical protein